MEKKSSYFKIAEQVNNYGFYGEIEIEFILTQNYRELNLLLAEPFERWRPGILFGTTYFIEHCVEQIGIDINVKNIKFNEVDTTNTIIAYLTYNALLKENNLIQKGHINFDKQLKSFVFLK